MPACQIMIDLGLVFFCLGWTGGVSVYWERLVWAVLALIFRGADLASQEDEQRMKLTPGTGEKTPGKEPRAVPSASRRWGLGSWQLWIGVVFSLGFLVLALRGVDLRETANALRRVNVLFLGAAVASFVFSTAAKAIRWQLLLAVRKAPSFGRAFSVLSVGLMVNAFLPARLGEFARAYLMGEAEADSKVYVLGTVAVEKVADLLFLLLSLVVLLLQMALPEWLAGSARGMALVLAILVPFFVLLAWQRDFILRMVEQDKPFRSIGVAGMAGAADALRISQSGRGAPPAPADRFVRLVIDRLDNQRTHQLPGFHGAGTRDAGLGFPAPVGGAAGRHGCPFFTGADWSFSIPGDSHPLDFCRGQECGAGI